MPLCCLQQSLGIMWHWPNQSQSCLRYAFLGLRRGGNAHLFIILIKSHLCGGVGGFTYSGCRGKNPSFLAALILSPSLFLVKKRKGSLFVRYLKCELAGENCHIRNLHGIKAYICLKNVGKFELDCCIFCSEYDANSIRIVPKFPEDP